MEANPPKPPLQDSYEAIILVTRGDKLPKRNYGTKLHPTYETSVRIKQNADKLTKPHLAIKFFDQYRDLYDDLVKLGVGEGLQYHVDAPFPPTFRSSALGMKMTEEALQERCYLLNKWMQALFAQFASYPPDAQKLISSFLSLEDNDKISEDNKNLIISLLSRTNSTAAISPQSILLAKEMSSCTLSPAGESDDNTSNSGTLVTTDAISQLENRKLSNRQISSSRKAHSIDSEAAALYTGAELAEYAKETILPPFLAVSVLRGDMVPKHEADNRLHHTYDTIIRILSLQDSTYKDKDNVDPEAYALQSHLPPITVSKVFDGYRQLKASLEDIGVFSRDTQDKAKQYNEGESIRRYAMIIPAIFPRTYRRSSLGLSLTEPQLQTRVVQLNLWVGALLTAFQTLPSEAQSMILDFLSIPPPDVDESDKALENTPQNAEALTRKRQNELFSAMLKGTYTPPPKPVEVDVKRKHTDMGLFSALMPKSKEEEVKFDKQNSFLKIDNNKSSTQSQSSLPLPPPAPLYTEVERQLSEASMATTASKVLTPMQIAEYSKEVIVHTFLAIHLVNGPKVAKKANEQATHPGYAITLRVLPLNEVQYASKDRIDGDAYQKLICGNNNQPYCISVTRAFDSYRTLKNELELCGVYCHDAKGIRPTSIILEASFPKTYKRSSLGVKLTDSQIRKRQAELNRFMGSVLTKYHLYSNDAKELISNFFQLDEDNPAEPFGRLMLSMMNRKFQPPMLPDKSAQSEASKQNGNAKNSQVTNKESSKKKKAKQGYSYGKVRGKFDPAKYAEEMGDEEDDGNSADINDHDYGQGGAGCCVPGGACNIM